MIEVGTTRRRLSNEMTNWELKLSRMVVPIRSEPLHTLSDARAYDPLLTAGNAEPR
jgi:hypothetical protein